MGTHLTYDSKHDTERRDKMSKGGDQGVSRMAGWVRVFATKPDGLSLLPSTHMVGRENQFLQVVL